MTARPSDWAIGWTAFAGILMIMLGGWWFIAGIVAVADESFYVVTQEWIFKFDVTTWGWIHIFLGILVLLAGFYLFTGAVWARVIGVVLAILSGLVAFAWVPYYPVWALLFVAASIAVVWALTAHGDDIAMA